MTATDDSPESVVDAYLAAMRQRNGRADLPIYSQASRAMLSAWVVTPAQMDNVRKSYARCRREATLVEADRAVIRYPPGSRECAPWFLVREGGRWRLDLTMMQSAVRFGRDNSWHFAAGAQHPYRFAFADWSFDRNGYPSSE